jgi:2,5-diketo-D-gluconate reductase A
MSAIPAVTLNNGVQMPILGFGVFQVTDAGECERSVYEAIQTGYRLIDTAASYGNEEAVGKAIKRSGAARAELFVTTKLWIQDAGYESAKKAFERSLQRLQLDYLDLYLIHQPYGDVYGAWRAMEELYGAGRIRAIGLSNFPPDRVMDLIVHHQVVPAVNQIEVHPFDYPKEVINFCQEQDIQVESYSPLGQSEDLSHAAITHAAERHGRTAAQVVLRWHLQHGFIPIPRSANRDHIAENFHVWDFSLSDEEMEELDAADRGAIWQTT